LALTVATGLSIGRCVVAAGGSGEGSDLVAGGVASGDGWFVDWAEAANGKLARTTAALMRRTILRWCISRTPRCFCCLDNGEGMRGFLAGDLILGHGAEFLLRGQDYVSFTWPIGNKGTGAGNIFSSQSCRVCLYSEIIHASAAQPESSTQAE
jgi:hypothetical protein